MSAIIALPTIIVPTSVAVTALTRLTEPSPPPFLRLIPLRRARHTTTSDRVRFAETTCTHTHRHSSQCCCQPLGLVDQPSKTTSQSSAMSRFLHTRFLSLSTPAEPLNNDDGRNRACHGNNVNGDHHCALAHAPSSTGPCGRRNSCTDPLRVLYHTLAATNIAWHYMVALQRQNVNHPQLKRPYHLQTRPGDRHSL